MKSKPPRGLYSPPTNECLGITGNMKANTEGVTLKWPTKSHASTNTNSTHATDIRHAKQLDPASAHSGSENDNLNNEVNGDNNDGANDCRADTGGEQCSISDELDASNTTRGLGRRASHIQSRSGTAPEMDETHVRRYESHNPIDQGTVAKRQDRHVRWALSVEKHSQTAKNAIKNEDDFASFLDRARVGKERRNNVKLHKHRSKGISKEANERFNAHYAAFTAKTGQNRDSHAPQDRRGSMDAACHRAHQVPKIQLSERAHSELPSVSPHPLSGKLTYAQVVHSSDSSCPATPPTQSHQAAPGAKDKDRNTEPTMRAIVTRTTSITSIKYNPSIEYLSTPFGTGQFAPAEGYFADDDSPQEGRTQTQDFGTISGQNGERQSQPVGTSQADALVDRAISMDGSAEGGIGISSSANGITPREGSDSNSSMISMQRISSYTFGKDDDEKYSLESHEDYGKPGTSSGTWNGTTGVRTSFRDAVQAQAKKTEFLSVANREVTPGPQAKRKGRFSVTPKLEPARSPPLSPRRTLSEQTANAKQNSSSTGNIAPHPRVGGPRKFKVSPVVPKSGVGMGSGALGHPMKPEVNRAHTSPSPPIVATLSEKGIEDLGSRDSATEPPKNTPNTHTHTNTLPVRPIVSSNVSVSDEGSDRPSARTVPKNSSLTAGTTSTTQPGSNRRPPSPLGLKVTTEQDFGCAAQSPRTHTPTDAHTTYAYQAQTKPSSAGARQESLGPIRIFEHAPSREDVMGNITETHHDPGTELSPNGAEGRPVPGESDKSPNARKTKSHSRRHSTGRAFKGLVKLARSASAYTGVGSNGNLATNSPHAAKRTNSDLDNTTAKAPVGDLSRVKSSLAGNCTKSADTTSQWESKDVKNTRETSLRRRSSGGDMFDEEGLARKQPLRTSSEKDRERTRGRSYQQIFSPSRWGKGAWGGSMSSVSTAGEKERSAETPGSSSINRAKEAINRTAEGLSVDAGKSKEFKRNSMENVLSPPKASRRNSDLHLSTDKKHTPTARIGELQRSDSDSGVLDGGGRLDVTRNISEESSNSTHVRDTTWRVIQTRFRALRGSSTTSFRAQIDRSNSSQSLVNKINSMPTRKSQSPLGGSNSKNMTEMQNPGDKSRERDKDERQASDSMVTKLFRVRSASNSAKEAEVQKNGEDR